MKESASSDMVIDIGNTRMKIGLYVKGELDGVLSFSNRAHKQVAALIENANAGRAIVSNVSKLKDPLAALIRDQLEVLTFTTDTPVPLHISYRSPHSLGTDRLANAVGAQVEFAERNVLIIDFGTCIKFDLLEASSRYLGGSISPGLQMRFKSMHQYTGRLPRIRSWKEEEGHWPGTDTRSSMISGVIQGIHAEILRYIDIAREHYPALEVVATGGDYAYFDKAFKNIIFARPYLTLQGLHEILRYNMDR